MKLNTPEEMAKAPKGPAVIWMRRLANIGFGIAAVYCAYLLILLGLAAKNNADFHGTLIGGTELVQVASTEPAIDLSQVAEKTVVVMWATWCGPCHSLLTSLRDEVSAGKISGSRIIAVSMAEPLADVKAYLEKTPLPFAIALDPRGELATKMKISGTPTVILLEPGGKINSVSTGGFRLTSKVIEFLNP